MNKKNWSTYQVDNPEYGVKLVSELTEFQAKTELCIAIELIEKLLGCSYQAIELAQKKNYTS
jgi:hypothetical protein